MKTLPDTLPNSSDELRQIVLEREAFWSEQAAQWQGQVAHWQGQYQSLLEQWRLAQHKRFAASSESYPDQGELFNDAELENDLAVQSDDADDTLPTTITSPADKKTRRSRLPDNLPREEVVHDLPEDEKICTCCGHALHQMGEECSEQLLFIPAKISVIRNIRLKYACRHCEQHGTAARIQVAPAAPTLLPKSFATPSLLAQIISSKFQFSLPLYRQEQMFARYGITLSRQTMSRWMLKCAECLTPLYELLHQQLLQREVIWSDDTRMKVVETKRDNSYMWLYGCGGDTPEEGKPPNIVLYDYQDGRGAENPVNFLRGYRGYLQADGYAGYGKTDAIIAGCMAHARRKFMEARTAQPKGKTGRADRALSLIQKLYRIEQAIKGEPADIIKARRQQEAKPLLDEFRLWLDKSTPQVPPKTLLGKALTYCVNQWPKLVRYLECGELSIDNNRAERAIKPFVIGRKNWLLANTRSGAQASALLYSLVETARANGLIPFDYLMHLFTEFPKLPPDSSLEPLLPWNVTLVESQLSGNVGL